MRNGEMGGVGADPGPGSGKGKGESKSIEKSTQRKLYTNKETKQNTAHTYIYILYLTIYINADAETMPKQLIIYIHIKYNIHKIILYRFALTAKTWLSFSIRL